MLKLNKPACCRFLILIAWSYYEKAIFLTFCKKILFLVNFQICSLCTKICKILIIFVQRGLVKYKQILSHTAK